MADEKTELEKAWEKLFMTIAEELGLVKFLEWVTSKMKLLKIFK